MGRSEMERGVIVHLPRKRYPLMHGTFNSIPRYSAKGSGYEF